MKKEEFFPKAIIVGKKIIFNTEAIETMELDIENARVIIMEVTNPDKVKNPKEILIVKTNGSLCDDLENIKDVFPPALIKGVSPTKDESGEVISAEIKLDDTTIESFKEVFGKEEKFKLLVCNTETALTKEFREQFDITNSYYKFAVVNDKRIAIGKEKNIKEQSEERININ